MSQSQPIVKPGSENVTGHTNHVTAESGNSNETQQMSQSQPIVTPESENVTGHTNHVTAESGNGNETQ